MFINSSENYIYHDFYLRLLYVLFLRALFNSLSVSRFQKVCKQVMGTLYYFKQSLKENGCEVSVLVYLKSVFLPRAD